MNRNLKLALAALLLAALFPYGWLAEVWPSFGRILYGVFDSPLTHAIGHAVGFFVLGLILLVARVLPPRIAQYALGVLAIALVQELFQQSYHQGGSLLDLGADLGADLVASGLALAAFRAQAGSGPAGASR